MINESFECFLKYDLQRRFQEQFYGEIFEYFKFIVPLLKKNNHTIDNEMECVGSQYLHLYYVPVDNTTNFIVFRNEQHSDMIFRVTIMEDMPYYSVEIMKGVDSLKDVLGKKINKKGIHFDSIEDLRSFARWNPDLLDERCLTTEEILSGKKYTALLYLSKMKDNGMLIQEDYKYSFTEQLKLFSLMNTMICGVCENLNMKIPKKFINKSKDVDKLISKLKKQLPKEIE